MFLTNLMTFSSNFCKHVMIISIKLYDRLRDVGGGGINQTFLFVFSLIDGFKVNILIPQKNVDFHLKFKVFLKIF